MAGFSKIRELEARKRALVTESEIYREAFREEVQNLTRYGTGFFHKFDRLRSVGPWVMLAGSAIVPVLGFVMGKRKKAAAASPSRLKRGLATALLGLRLYRKYGPMVRTLATQFRIRRRSASEARFRSAEP